MIGCQVVLDDDRVKNFPFASRMEHDVDLPGYILLLTMK